MVDLGGFACFQVPVVYTTMPCFEWIDLTLSNVCCFLTMGSMYGLYADSRPKCFKRADNHQGIISRQALQIKRPPEPETHKSLPNR